MSIGMKKVENINSNRRTYGLKKNKRVRIENMWKKWAKNQKK